MSLPIGAAPCSWGVEFAGDPRNPPWERVLDETVAVGYRGIELGPVGFMPEHPAELGEALAKRQLALVGGVMFRPFHDPRAWDDVLDGVRRTARALEAHGAARMVFIDSIAETRAPFAGRADEAPRLAGGDRTRFYDRIRTAAKIGVEEHGLAVSIHAHAAGYIEFEDELEALLDAFDERLMKVCLDSGHSVYAGFDAVAFYRRHASRVEYLHFKDVDLAVRDRVIADRIGFYDACAQGLFCNLGRGGVDFSGLKQAVEECGFEGWATIEQDCDPAGDTSPIDDARINLDFLRSMNLAD